MNREKIKHASQIEMISIEKINILNPRIRNQKIFYDIATNITQVGLKKPITVTVCKSGAPGKDYDLVCGQGRLEAFIACGQQEIPAIVVDASEEQALIMSLVENLARRQHRASDLLQGIEILLKQGYDAKSIADKTGLSPIYTAAVLNLMERGEDRLLVAVETGHIPMRVAVRIAESPEEEQGALQEAYETKQLRGHKFLTVKRLLQTRRRHGKNFSGARISKKTTNSDISARAILKVYQKEVDRKRLLTRKANSTSNRLLFIKEALRDLLQEVNFKNILQTEGLNSLPKPLAGLFDNAGDVHG